MAYVLTVNGKPHTMDPDGDHPAAVGASRHAPNDCHQVRMRYGAVRRVHSRARRQEPSSLRLTASGHRVITAEVIAVRACESIGPYPPAERFPNVPKLDISAARTICLPSWRI